MSSSAAAGERSNRQIYEYRTSRDHRSPRRVNKLYIGAGGGGDTALAVLAAKSDGSRYAYAMGAANFFFSRIVQTVFNKATFYYNNRGTIAWKAARV